MPVRLVKTLIQSPKPKTDEKESKHVLRYPTVEGLQIQLPPVFQYLHIHQNSSNRFVGGAFTRWKFSSLSEKEKIIETNSDKPHPEWGFFYGAGAIEGLTLVS